MNIVWLKYAIKPILAILFILAIVAGVWKIRYEIKERDDRIATLATQLATSENTVEIQKGLYAIKTREVDDLNLTVHDLQTFLGHADLAIAALIKQIEESNQKILTLNSLVVKWKKAYEGALEANQSEEEPEIPGGIPRKKVEFTKDFGMIGVSGYTLTDPPEGFVKVEQLRPLRLVLAVTKNKDGTWSSMVTSSEENVEIDIALSGIDLSIIKERWYQKLWLDVGANKDGGSIGISYHGERWSFGPRCDIALDYKTCGASIGYRLFK